MLFTNELARYPNPVTEARPKDINTMRPANFLLKLIFKFLIRLFKLSLISCNVCFELVVLASLESIPLRILLSISFAVALFCVSSGLTISSLVLLSGIFLLSSPKVIASTKFSLS